MSYCHCLKIRKWNCWKIRWTWWILTAKTNSFLTIFKLDKLDKMKFIKLLSEINRQFLSKHNPIVVLFQGNRFLRVVISVKQCVLAHIHQTSLSRCFIFLTEEKFVSQITFFFSPFNHLATLQMHLVNHWRGPAPHAGNPWSPVNVKFMKWMFLVLIEP